MRHQLIAFNLLLVFLCTDCSLNFDYRNRTSITRFAPIDCIIFSDSYFYKLQKCNRCCGRCDDIRCCFVGEPNTISKDSCDKYNITSKHNFATILLIISIIVIFGVGILCFFDYKSKNTEALQSTVESFLNIIQLQNQQQQQLQQMSQNNIQLNQTDTFDLPPPYNQVSSSSINRVTTRVEPTHSAIEINTQPATATTTIVSQASFPIDAPIEPLQTSTALPSITIELNTNFVETTDVNQDAAANNDEN